MKTIADSYNISLPKLRALLTKSADVDYNHSDIECYHAVTQCLPHCQLLQNVTPNKRQSEIAYGIHPYNVEL